MDSVASSEAPVEPEVSAAHGSPSSTVDPESGDEPTAADKPVAKARTGSKGRKPSKGPAIKDVRSVEGLLRYAYSRKGRFSIPSATRDAISSEDASISDLRPLICDLAAEDELIKVPVRLLAAVDRAEGTLKFRRRCLSVMENVLLAHPTISSIPGLDTALANPHEGDPSSVLREAAAALSAGATSSADGEAAKAKRPNRRELAENGVTALALYFAIQRDWKDTRLAHELESVLWADECQTARGKKYESTRALLVEASPAALGASSAAWRAEIKEAEKRAADAERLHRDADAERAEADELRVAAEHEAERLRGLLTEHETKAAELRAVIAEEQRARHVLSSHAVDDYENLRTRVIRVLDRQLKLLEDGLHALRNGSTAVTEEYLERVTGAIVNHLDSLREANVSEGDQE